jgi:hypothetical protein
MINFLDAYDLPKLKHKDTKTHKHIKNENEIKRIIKSLLTKAEFYQNFKVELIPLLLKLFHKIEREKTHPKLFYEAIILIPKLDQDAMKMKTIDQFP